MELEIEEGEKKRRAREERDLKSRDRLVFMTFSYTIWLHNHLREQCLSYQSILLDFCLCRIDYVEQ